MSCTGSCSAQAGALPHVCLPHLHLCTTVQKCISPCCHCLSPYPPAGTRCHQSWGLRATEHFCRRCFFFLSTSITRLLTPVPLSPPPSHRCPPALLPRAAVAPVVNTDEDLEQGPRQSDPKVSVVSPASRASNVHVTPKGGAGSGASNPATPIVSPSNVVAKKRSMRVGFSPVHTFRRHAVSIAIGLVFAALAIVTIVLALRRYPNDHLHDTTCTLTTASCTADATQTVYCFSRY